MNIGKKILLMAQYVRRIKSPEKYVTLKRLCDYCGCETEQFSTSVQKQLDKTVWHICSQGMLIAPTHSVWLVSNKEEADFAMRRKARALISEIQYADYPCIIVKEPIALYAKMCQYYRALQKKVSATVVTGSIGKSTACGMLASVYSAAGKTYYSPGNGNDPCEVGYMVQHIPSDCEKMVQEVCENKVGVTQYLSQMAMPSVVVITAIDKSHFEEFGSEEAVVKEVCEAAKGLPEDGKVVVCKEDFHWNDSINREVVVVSDGDSEADYYAKDVSVLKSGLSFVVVDNSNGTEHPVRLNNIYARHNVSAALRAFAAARCEELPYSLIVKGLAEYHTTGVRQNVIWTEDGICLYADCYNAIATSVRSAVETSDITPVTGKRIAVLGDIEECGQLSESQHDESVGIVNQSSFDILITIGEKINAAVGRSHFRDGLRVIPCKNKNEVEKCLRDNMKKGDLVLLKSSHSGKLQTIIEHLWPSDYRKMNSYNKEYRSWKFHSAIS